MQELVLILMILRVTCCLHAENSSSLEIRWVDYLDETPPELEVFFDRIVAIVYNGPSDEKNTFLQNRTVIAPGVLFKNNFVLTSFNPFRKYLNRKPIENITIDVLNTRIVEGGAVTGYTFEKYNVECARQVLPDSERIKSQEEFVADQESPLHDLMVIKLKGNVTFVDPLSSSNDNYKGIAWNSARVGPLITALSSEGKPLGQAISFASFGYRNDLEIWKYCLLHHTSYKEVNNVITDCEEWIPREWGYFICLKNVDDFAGIGSGAMLFHDDTLYGVGSFLMKAGSESVLVFTDVRKYEHLIYTTCT